MTNERLCLSNRIDLIILEISEGIKEIQTLKSHKKSIRNIININYNQILSLSIDGVLNIWSLNKKSNLYFCITTVILSKNTNLKYNEILLIDDTKIVYYEIKDQQSRIKFLNLKTFLYIKEINNIDCLPDKSKMIVYEKYLIICSKFCIYVLDLNLYEIIYIDDSLKNSSIYKFKNQIYIFDSYLDFNEYKLENNKLLKIKDIFTFNKYYIQDLVLLNNQKLIIVNDHEEPIIWKFIEEESKIEKDSETQNNNFCSLF